MPTHADPLPPRRMSPLDRQWAHHWSSMLLTPIDAPSVDDVRALLLDLFEEVPDSVLASRPDVSTGRWRPVAAGERKDHVAQLVSAGPAVEQGGLDAYQLAHRAPPGWEPAIRVVVGPSSILVSNAHVVGDAVGFTTLSVALATLDAAGLRALERRATVGTIARGVAHQVRPSGAAWVREVRNRRRPSTTPAPAGSAAIPRRSGTAPQEPPTSQVTVSLTTAEMAATTAWGRETHPTARLSAVLTSAVYRTLVAEGVDLEARGFNTVIDVRRYLPADDQTRSGNLAKSLFVLTPDIADPTSVAAAQSALLASGWPLPSTLIGALQVGRRAPAAAESRTPGDRPVVLDLIVMTSLPGLERIPWSAAGSRHMTGVTYTVGVGGLSIFAIRTRDFLEVSASFVTGSLPTGAVRRALETLRDIPALFRPAHS